MKDFLKLCVVTSLLVGNLSANEKINQCLKQKNCMYTVIGGFSADPSMAFVVLKKSWMSFSEKDKSDLKQALKIKINEARKNPDKFNGLSPSAPVYERVNSNIRNMHSYSVVLSNTKSSSGALMLDNEIMKNW